MCDICDRSQSAASCSGVCGMAVSENSEISRKKSNRCRIHIRYPHASDYGKLTQSHEVLVNGLSGLDHSIDAIILSGDSL